jgi:hypothetical protein
LRDAFRDTWKRLVGEGLRGESLAGLRAWGGVPRPSKLGSPKLGGVFVDTQLPWYKLDDDLPRARADEMDRVVETWKQERLEDP